MDLYEQHSQQRVIMHEQVREKVNGARRLVIKRLGEYQCATNNGWRMVRGGFAGMSSPLAIRAGRELP